MSSHDRDVGGDADADADADADSSPSFRWTASAVARSVAVFVLAGVAEIVGGWLVWAAVRGNAVVDSDTDEGGKKKKPWWYALLGSIVLVLYGFVPTLQPTDDGFGRIYAAYGGFFIVMSFAFGWVLDGDRPDAGDVAGGAIALAGVLVIMFWPRRG